MYLNCHIEESKEIIKENLKKKNVKKEETKSKEIKQNKIPEQKFNNQPTYSSHLRLDKSIDSVVKKCENTIIKNNINGEELMKNSKINKCVEISERMKSSLAGIVNSEFLSWVQTNSIPHIMTMKNTLIKSPSGSGKTLSYAIPIIDRLGSITPKINRKNGIFALIIVPTKELAKQTWDVFNKILQKFIWINATAIFGENKKKSEKMQIRKGVNILITSPGRLADHLINTQALDLSNIQTLVFDEADLLLDLGYENKIQQILNEMKSRYRIDFNRLQLIMLSATLNSRVNQSFSFIRDYVFIDAMSSNSMPIAYEMLSSNSQLIQTVVTLPIKWRLVGLILFLHHILSPNSQNFKILIFVSTIQSVNYHSKLLQSIFNSFPLFFARDSQFFVLHGDMEIKERMKVFKNFDQSTNGILISTDVAARGLDFKNVLWVIQYNPARNPVDYVHRIGRTARAGNQGSAVVFLSPHEIDYLEILKESGMEIGVNYQLKQLTESWLTTKNVRKFVNPSDYIIENEGTSINTNIKSLVNNNPSLTLLGSKCFASLIKAYASYPQNLRRFFNPKAFHLGHLADSLGLSDTPNNIIKMSRDQNFTKSQNKSSVLRLKESKVRKSSKPKSNKPSTMTVSEYTSSVDYCPTFK